MKVSVDIQIGGCCVHLLTVLRFAANLGAKAAFVWVGLSVVSFIWTWLEVPETKGRSAEELDRLFAEKKPAWRFE
jgi:hypothetical protein